MIFILRFSTAYPFWFIHGRITFPTVFVDVEFTVAFVVELVVGVVVVKASVELANLVLGDAIDTLVELFSIVFSCRVEVEFGVSVVKIMFLIVVLSGLVFFVTMIKAVDFVIASTRNSVLFVGYRYVIF